MPVAKKENFEQKEPLIPIILSVVIVSIFMVYPLPYMASGWRPNFMLLIMMFWVMCQPIWCGVWFALILGFLTDLLMGLPLGMNPMCFILIAFLARFFTREKRIMSATNLWIIVALASILYSLMMMLLLTMAGNEFAFLRYGQAWLTTVFVWPIFYYGLKKWRSA